MKEFKVKSTDMVLTELPSGEKQYRFTLRTECGLKSNHAISIEAYDSHAKAFITKMLTDAIKVSFDRMSEEEKEAMRNTAENEKR